MAYITLALCQTNADLTSKSINIYINYEQFHLKIICPLWSEFNLTVTLVIINKPLYILWTDLNILKLFVSEFKVKAIQICFWMLQRANR